MPKQYFDSLNYTIGNEDTLLELAVLPKNIRHVVAIAGSGARIIPLLSKNPHYVTCVDSSREQLSLAELRLSSLHALDYETFLSFWGYPPRSMMSNERRTVFEDLTMSPEARKNTELLFEKHDWRSLLYVGRWERTFKKLSKINRLIVGNRGLGVFSCLTKEDQANYIQTKFPQRAWSFAIFVLGNAAVFNTLLYKGNFPQNNIPASTHTFYLERFKKLFEQDVARKNYFLQLLFFGMLRFSDGLPTECDPGIFEKAKQGLYKAKITFVCNDILEEAQSASIPIDFLSLSDVPSYLPPPLEQEFLQIIKDGMSLGGIIVNRYYLHIPEHLNTYGYQDITDGFKEAISKEKVQMYSFGMYKKM